MKIKNITLFKKNNGSAMVVVLMLSVILVPVSIMLLSTMRTYHRSSFKEGQIKTATDLANNAIVDVMRQLSQAYYQDHYDPDFLDREESFYKNGFSDCTIVPNEKNRYISITAKSKSGTSSLNPLAKKTLYCTIKFRSPWTEFGNFFGRKHNLVKSKMLFEGPFCVTNGYLKLTGNDLKFIGGPVLVNGDLLCPGTNNIIYGDLYCSGTISSDVTITGNVYKYYPNISYPTIRQDYYINHANLTINNDSIITFYTNAAKDIGYFDISQGGVVVNTITIPPDGYLICALNCNIKVTGSLRGRVTIANFDTTGTTYLTWDWDTSKGKTIILGNLVYAHGPDLADGKYHARKHTSLAIIASSLLMFELPAIPPVDGSGQPPTTYNVCGAFLFRRHSLLDGPNYTGAKSNQTILNIQGVRTCGTNYAGKWNHYVSDVVRYKHKSENDPDFYKGCYRNIYYDENLAIYPPPYLPEKPYVVSWHYK